MSATASAFVKAEAMAASHKPSFMELKHVAKRAEPVRKLPEWPIWHSEHPTLCSGDMTIQRMDNVLIVVDDLEAAKAFFAELGMELEGEARNEGRWVDRVVGLDDVRSDIAMMRTPDGHGRLELAKFHTPPAVRAEPESAPANTLGIRRIMFAVDDIDDVVARLRSHGAELIGEIAQYEDIYRLCFLRGPEGIIIGLAEQLS
jgi:catechol 2,3-dioxygenase-like lactoylglutathione lyase family enzyme